MALLCANASTGSAETVEEKARAHYRTGLKLYNISEYEPAAKEFKEAYKLKDDPAFLFNIAQCYRKLGNTEEAVTYLRRFLKQNPREPSRSEARQLIRELEAAPRTAAPVATTPRPLTTPAPTVPTTVTPSATGPPATQRPPAAPTPPSPAPAAAPAPVPPPVYAPPLGAQAPPAQPAVSPMLAASTQPAPVATPQPLYRRWWFWAGLAAGLAGGAVAVVIATSDNGNPNCRGVALCWGIAD